MLLALSRSGLVAVAVVALLLTSAARAAVNDWTAVKARGTVVHLVGEHWEELPRGGIVANGGAVRTLESGRLQLQRNGGTISLGPDTVIEIDQGGKGLGTTIRQHSGSVTIEVGRGQPARMVVETPVLAVVTQGGVVSVSFDDGIARVTVGSGSVSVVDRLQGTTSVLGAGQAATNSIAAGMGIVAAGTVAGGDGGGSATSGGGGANSANPGANGNAGGNSGDNGNSGGNAGDNGNAGGNGNAGDNGKGNSAGGGNDNDNANGNGNGNGSANGNN